MKRLKIEGVKDWVGKVSVVAPETTLILDSYQPVQILLQLPEKKNAKGAIEETLLSIKLNDIVRFSTQPDDKAGIAPAGKTFHGFSQQIRLESLTAVEKLASAANASAPKPPAGKGKKP